MAVIGNKASTVDPKQKYIDSRKTVTPVKSTFNAGGNINNYDSTNEDQKALADAGQAWWDAKNRGDQAGMDAAAKLGSEIRINRGSVFYDSKTGTSTFGAKRKDEDGQQIDPFGGILGDLKSGADAAISAGTAQINQTRDAQLAQLAKALNDAIASGEMSVRDAKAAFDSQSKVIDQQVYQQAQLTNLTGEDRGISNSQQLLGLMAGDNARKNSLINENMTTRDKQIADIKTRLDNIKNNNAVDVGNVNATAGYQAAQLSGNVQSAMLGKMADLKGQNYFMDKGFGQQKEMQSIQQKYTQDNMGLNQKYTQDNMNLDQKFKEKNMGIEYKNQLGLMAKGQQYDLQKMDVAFQNDLTKMRKQAGYDMSMMTAKMKADDKAAGDRFKTELAQEQTKYEIARDRELAKYDPNSKEYQIRKAQMDDAHTLNMNEKYQNMVFEAGAKSIMEDPYIKENGVVAPTKPKGYDSMGSDNPKKRDYDNKMLAYRRAEGLLSGTSDPNNLYAVPSNNYSTYSSPGDNSGGASSSSNPWNIFGDTGVYGQMKDFLGQ